MHSLFQPNLASPAKPSMSTQFPPALASSGIFQLNNFRLASAFALLVRPAIPLRLAPQVSPSVRVGGHPPVLTGCPLRQPVLAINFRLAPTVYSSSLPAPNSDALTGHQLNETLRLFNLWKQVQKSSKFVDFTRVGALLGFSEAALHFRAHGPDFPAPEPAFSPKKSALFPKNPPNSP
jgi:hypothetical protein